MPDLRKIGACLLVLAGLAGCGEQKPADTAPPVLVAHPGGGPGEAAAAYPGEVHAREESALSFRLPGNLVRREVDAGARVRRGQVLAVLDAGDQDLQAKAAQAELSAAQAELARIRGDRDRYAQLVERQLISRSGFEAQEAAYRAALGRVEAARAQWDVSRNQAEYTRLRAPRDGVVASRQAEAGQVVAAGQTIYTLAADGGREVSIHLPESRVRAFEVGQPAEVELWSAPGERMAGRIREIAPAADPQTRTYAARVELLGGAVAAVELGQSARVFLEGAKARDALTVPLSAVQRSEDGGSLVWVVDPAARTAHARPVRLGPYGSDSVPVLDGLRPEDWVVVAGGHLLREGQAARPVDRQGTEVAEAATATSPP